MASNANLDPLRNVIIQVLTDVQDEKNKLELLALRLVECCLQNGAILFSQEFWLRADRVLPIGKRELAVERIVALIGQMFSVLCRASTVKREDNNAAASPDLAKAKTIAEESVEHSLRHLAAIAPAADKAVRFRVCQITATILTSLPSSFELSCAIYTLLILK